MNERPKTGSPFFRGLAQGVGIWAAVAGLTLTSVLVAAPLSGAWKLFESGEILEANDLNTNFSALKTAVEKLPEVPVGTILPWHKSMPETPDLPVGWVECNGQLIDDSTSPYDGQNAPNLNQPLNGYHAKGLFLRGHMTSGLTEDDSLQGHTHQDSGHSHSMRGIEDGNSIRNVGMAGAPTEPNAVVTRNTSNASASLAGPTAYGFGAPRVGSETRPASFSVVWIIRVK